MNTLPPIRELLQPVLEVVQSRKLNRKPYGKASMSSAFRSAGMAGWFSAPPLDDGNVQMNPVTRSRFYGWTSCKNSWSGISKPMPCSRARW